MSKTLTIDIFDVSSIDAAVKYMKRIGNMKELEKRIASRLAEEGCGEARVRFASARYTGTNDVQVRWENRGRTAVIIAEGEEVLFIEYGTGVGNAPFHPEASEYGMIRGTYGKGRGANPPWRYIGEPGNVGTTRWWTNDKGSLVETRGYGANMAMYNTRKNLARKMKQIAREELDRWLER